MRGPFRGPGAFQIRFLRHRIGPRPDVLLGKRRVHGGLQLRGGNGAYGIKRGVGDGRRVEVGTRRLCESRKRKQAEGEEPWSHLHKGSPDRSFWIAAARVHGNTSGALVAHPKRNGFYGDLPLPEEMA